MVDETYALAQSRIALRPSIRETRRAAQLTGLTDHRGRPGDVCGGDLYLFWREVWKFSPQAKFRTLKERVLFLIRSDPEKGAWRLFLKAGLEYQTSTELEVA